MKPFIALLVALVTLVLPASQPAANGMEGTSWVQLSPFRAPARVPGPRLRNFSTGDRMVPVRVILQVRSAVDADTLCAREDTVRLAIIEALRATPIPLRRDGRLKLFGVPERLQGPVNRSLGARMVMALFVFPTGPDEAGACETVTMGVGR